MTISIPASAPRHPLTGMSALPASVVRPWTLPKSERATPPAAASPAPVAPSHPELESDDAINLTLWPSVSGHTKIESSVSWAKIPEFLRDAGDKPSKSACPLVKLARFGNLRTAENSLRHDANVTSITGVEGDYDGGEIGPTEAIARLEAHNLRAYVITTWSHTPDKPRWRVLAPLSASVEPKERLRYAEALNGVLGGILASESANLSQSYFIGNPPGVEPEILATFDDPEEGYALDEIAHLDELRVPFKAKLTPHEAVADAPQRAPDAALLAELLEGDNVHANALAIVARLVYRGVSDDLIRVLFKALAQEVGKVRGEQRAKELTGAELERMIAGAKAKGYAPPLALDFSIVAGKGVEAPAPITARELMTRHFADLRWCVPDILPEGTYLLSAKPKVGKSWLALQIALAVATERSALGKRVQGGSALVLALEDNQRRLKSRLQKLGAFHLPNEDQLARLHLETEWPRVDQGGAVLIEQWLQAHPDARLVVVDTLAKMRPPTGGRASAYEQDYQALAPIKALSDRHNVTILIVTHNRKMDSDDPLEMISGTLGLSGGCDGALVLDRPRGAIGATLHLIGRDIEEDGAFALRFQRENCTWEMLGGSEEITASNERAHLLKIFKEEHRGLTPREVATLAERKASSVRRLLRAMLEAGNLEQGEDGKYYLHGQALEAEHPEHPEQTEQAEHPEQLQSSDGS